MLKNDDYDTEQQIKENRKIVGWVIVIILGLICLITWFVQQEHIADNVEHINSQEKYVWKMDNKTKNYTLPKLKKHYDKSEPDLEKLQAQNSNMVRRGVTLAFGKSGKKWQYRKNQNMISRMSGPSLTNLFNRTINPSSDDASNYQSAVNNHNTFAEKLGRCQISYGAFDDYENVIPVNIYIRFYTSPFSDNASNDILHRRKYSHTADMEINGTLYVKQHYINVNNHYMYVYLHKNHR